MIMIIFKILTEIFTLTSSTDMVLKRLPAVSEMIDDYNNTISEYPDSVVYLQTIDRDIPDGLLNPSHTEPHDYMGTDRWLQRRKSRFFFELCCFIKITSARQYFLTGL